MNMLFDYLTSISERCYATNLIKDYFYYSVQIIELSDISGWSDGLSKISSAWQSHISSHLLTGRGQADTDTDTSPAPLPGCSTLTYEGGKLATFTPHSMNNVASRIFDI